MGNQEEEYDALKPAFDLLREMLKARTDAGLSQAEVAERKSIEFWSKVVVLALCV